MKNLLISFLFFSLTASAQKSTVFQLNKQNFKRGITSCKWHAGDNPEWAKADFDDSQWEDVNPETAFADAPQLASAEIGWFRCHIDVDSSLINYPISTWFYNFGASEFYFNEQILYKIGVVSKDPTIEKAYSVCNGVNLNMVFSKKKGNVIAIRHSLTHSHFYLPKCLFTRTSLIDIAFEDGLSRESNITMIGIKSIYSSLGMGLFFGFAFMHFSFYYFLRKQKANLLFGLAMFVTGISLFIQNSYIDPITISLNTTFRIIQLSGWVTFYIFLILAIHSYLKQPIKKTGFLVMGIIVFGFVFTFTDIYPKFESLFFQYDWSLGTLYYVLIVRKTIKTGNKDGLMIYYAGIISLISLAILPIIPYLDFVESNQFWIQAILFNTFWLSVTIGMSLTLARDFARTDSSLQRKLKEVLQLSNEKQQILATQNETLEKQVVERTEALNQSLAELKTTQAQLIEKEQIASAAAIRLQELDTVKTRLYTNITHEFRTPLTVILGMAQQIKDAPQAFTTESLGMIKRNGQNLLNLVNQMLDLSKLESGKLTLHYQRSNVVSYMKYLVESFHSFAESKVVKIHFISDLEQLTMDFDETYLQQIVSNLLTNAVKFTPKGGDIYVSLSIQSTTFSFKVRDTGKGIAEANLPLIFDRFYQVDDSTTRHGEGTGIGLSLTRELVKLMEGTITVRSQVNKGTEFEVILPIHHIVDLKTEEKPLPIFKQALDNVIEVEDTPLSINGNISTEKPLVLIADDNADVRTYIAACLGTDYQLLIAKDGQECEDMAFEHIPDLIISDVMMPFKDGFEVCKTLKNDERTSHIPIIMLTAKADIDSKLQGLERGADVYLMKPFNKDELLLRIKKLLELRQQLQAFYRSTLGSNAVVIARNEATEGVQAKAEDVP